MTGEEMESKIETQNSESPQLTIISPPLKTVEMLYNRIAIIYFGLFFTVLGLVLASIQPQSFVNIVGVVLIIIAFFLYYFLFLDFVAHYFLKVFGIVYLNYQQNRTLWYLCGIVLITVIVFGAVVNYVPSTSIYYGPSFIFFALACAFISDLLKPMYKPYMDRFYEKYLKNVSDKYLKNHNN